MKGDCFTVAAELVIDGGGALVLCHGRPLGQGGAVRGQRYWHAWAEDGRMVYDLSNDQAVIVSMDTYYDVGRIVAEHVRRYGHHEAHAQLLAEGTWGPWPDDEPDDQDAEPTTSH
jgi:hypothetical protein